MYGATQNPSVSLPDAEYLAKLYATYTQTADPRVALAQTEAQVKNLKDLAAKPGLLQGYYKGELRKAQAKAKAMRENLALTTEGEAATRDWRAIGQTGAGIGIVAGVALIGLLVAATYKVATYKG
jgi:LPS O-antigen subunit length determinant protein (WzzB/FepE family)